jgi:spermidine/putrescine transport system substrate-binding protein
MNRRPVPPRRPLAARRAPLAALAALCALTVLAALASCSRPAKGPAVSAGDPKKAGEVTVFMWSEYIDPALVTRFEKESGKKLILDTYENTETMMSKVASAGDLYDVVVVSDHAIPVMAAKGTFRPLDLSKVPNAKNVSARFRSPAYDPQGKWTLPYQWGTMGIVYRTDKLPGFRPTWAALLEPARQPGPVVLLDSMRDLMAAALFFKGFSPNTHSAPELKTAGDLLAGARTKRMVGFYGSPDSVQKVVAGDAWAAIAYNGDAVARLDEKTDFAVPAEGTIIWVDAMTVPARAPNPAGACAFINYILAADVGAQLSNYLSYATPNEASLPLIEKKIREDARVYPTEDQMAKMKMLEDVGDATVLYDQVWTRVKAGQ